LERERLHAAWGADGHYRHNERIAWGFTNNEADVQDLYLEAFNPAAPTNTA